VKGILFGVASAALIAACAGMGAQKSAAVAPRPQAADAGAAGMPSPGDSPEHQEIARLDAEIADTLGRRNIEQAGPETCGASCDMAAVAMDTKPINEDPRLQTCKPSPSDTCKDSCTLSDSICKNADRICTIAHQLGDHDAYANDKCVQNSKTCQASKQRCCSCL